MFADDHIDDLAHQTDPYPVYTELRREGARRLADGRWIVARASDVEALLAARGVAVGFRPSGPEPSPGVQSRMARFSDGADHDRRRAIAVAQLDGLPPVALRSRARELAARRLQGMSSVELMIQLARHVPVAVLAEALGLAAGDGSIVAAVAGARELALAIAPPVGRAPGDPGAPASRLAGLLGMRSSSADAGADSGLDEDAVNIVALLFQAVDATAGLIGNAVAAAHRFGLDLAAGTNHALVAETCRFDAPVQRTTRVTTEELDLDGVVIPPQVQVVVLLAAANRDSAFVDRPDGFDLTRQHRSMTFGTGSRSCPGAQQALALAAGVLDALGDAGASLREADVVYEPRANLRIPQRLQLQLSTPRGT